MRADGRHERNLTNTPGNDEFEPAWSPNGRLIAFVGDRGGDDPRSTRCNPHGSRGSATHGRHPRRRVPGLVARRQADRLRGRPFDAPDVFTMRADGSRPDPA